MAKATVNVSTAVRLDISLETVQSLRDTVKEAKWAHPSKRARDIIGNKGLGKRRYKGQWSPDNGKGGFQGICHNCGQKGHKKFECPNPSARLMGSVDTNQPEGQAAKSDVSQVSMLRDNIWTMSIEARPKVGHQRVPRVVTQNRFSGLEVTGEDYPVLSHAGPTIPVAPPVANLVQKFERMSN